MLTALSEFRFKKLDAVNSTILLTWDPSDSLNLLPLFSHMS